MYQFLSVHSCVDGHFGCFHVLVIVYLAAVDVWVPVSFWFWSSPLIDLVVGWSDHMVAQFLPCNGTSILFSLVAVTSLHSSNSVEGMHFSKATSVFIVCRLCSDGHFDWCEVIFFSSLDLHVSNYSWCWAFFHVGVNLITKTWGQTLCPWPDEQIKK